MRWRNRTRLGEVLVDMGLVPETRVRLALAVQRRGAGRLGETLVDLGFLNRAQLTLGLAEQYRRVLAGAAGLTLMALQPTGLQAAERGTMSMSITANVPPRHVVRLDQPLVNMVTDPEKPGVRRFVAHLLQQTNWRDGYTLRIESENGGTGTSPMLVDDATGTRIPYRVAYADQPVEFKSGAARLPSADPRDRTPHAAELSFTTLNSQAGQGFYTDRLTIVVAAN